MLPARYRMTRSSDFGATVSRGVRAVQPDLVVHTLRADNGAEDGP
ncbi:ribonuclease P protein component, partial [Mycolicibacterium elephantis]